MGKGFFDRVDFTKFQSTLCGSSRRRSSLEFLPTAAVNEIGRSSHIPPQREMESKTDRIESSGSKEILKTDDAEEGLEVKVFESLSETPSDEYSRLMHHL